MKPALGQENNHRGGYYQGQCGKFEKVEPKHATPSFLEPGRKPVPVRQQASLAPAGFAVQNPKEIQEIP